MPMHMHTCRHSHAVVGGGGGWQNVQLANFCGSCDSGGFVCRRYFARHRATQARYTPHAPAHVRAQPCQCTGLTTQSGRWDVCAHPHAVAATAGPTLCAAVSETHGQRCTVRDMRHEVGATPPDHRTGSTGLGIGEACRRTSHSPWPLCGGGGGGGLAQGLGI